MGILVLHRLLAEGVLRGGGQGQRQRQRGEAKTGKASETGHGATSRGKDGSEAFFAAHWSIAQNSGEMAHGPLVP